MSALTDLERAKIRAALGWPARYHLLNSRLEHALDAVNDLPGDLSLVRVLIANMDDIDARLTDALDRLQASAVGSITLNPGELTMLRTEGNRQVASLARILYVDVIDGGKYAIMSRGGEMKFEN